MSAASIAAAKRRLELSATELPNWARQLLDYIAELESACCSQGRAMNSCGCTCDDALGESCPKCHPLGGAMPAIGNGQRGVGRRESSPAATQEIRVAPDTVNPSPAPHPILRKFGWWDHFNAEFVQTPEDAEKRRKGGNKLTPLYTAHEAIETPSMGRLQENLLNAARRVTEVIGFTIDVPGVQNAPRVFNEATDQDEAARAIRALHDAVRACPSP